MPNMIMAAFAAVLLVAASGALADDMPHGDDSMHRDGDAMPHGDAPGHHGGMNFGQPGMADQATRTVDIILYDNYFDPESVDVAAGETVRFVVRNEGSVVHEFNIGTAAMHRVHQEEMAMMVEHGVIEVDRINHDMMNVDMGGGHVMSHDDPNSALLEPGQEAEIVWTFSNAMDLEFACNVPGHYDAGMMGEITVAP